jgi:hypothetical protein
MLAAQSRMNVAFIRYLQIHEARLAKVAGQKRMPPPGELSPLGCGVYGCVYPTQTPGLVLKATYDQSEGTFVGKAIALGEFPAGIVRYELLIDEDAEEEGRTGWRYGRQMLGPRLSPDELRLYLLWREEAFFGPPHLTTIRKAHEGLADYAQAVAAYLDEARASTRPSSPSRAWASIGESLKEPGLPASRTIRAALRFYHRHGMAIADLHDENIGVAIRSGQPQAVIVDPGQAIFR